MTTRHVTGTLIACEAYEAKCRKALGLPMRGVHIGGGRHVDIPKSPPGPGWTTAWDDPREHPTTKGLYAVVSADIKDSEKLNFGEKQSAATKEAAAVELGKDWEPKEDEPVPDTKPAVKPIDTPIIR